VSSARVLEHGDGPAADRCCFSSYTLIRTRRQGELADSGRAVSISFRQYAGKSSPAAASMTGLGIPSTLAKGIWRFEPNSAATDVQVPARCAARRLQWRRRSTRIEEFLWDSCATLCGQVETRRASTPRPSQRQRRPASQDRTGRRRTGMPPSPLPLRCSRPSPIATSRVRALTVNDSTPKVAHQRQRECQQAENSRDHGRAFHAAESACTVVDLPLERVDVADRNSRVKATYRFDHAGCERFGRRRSRTHMQR
jgi:hypothetical protein